MAKQKRPKDTNQLAKFIVDLATKSDSDLPSLDKLSSKPKAHTKKYSKSKK